MKVTVTTPNKSGFTLIELLVVIASIAILAGLLLPALNRAKGKAQQTACLSRLKQWAMAAAIYADDHDNLLPREKCVTGTHTSADIADPANSDVWFNILPLDYLRQEPASAFADTLHEFHDPGRFFQCPAARFASGLTTPAFSLVYNSKLQKSTNVFECFNVNRVCVPSDTVLFLDAGVPGENRLFPKQKLYNGQPSAWANRMSGRHAGGANLAFFDGNVQWYRGARVVDPLTGDGYPSPSEVLWAPCD